MYLVCVQTCAEQQNKQTSRVFFLSFLSCQTESQQQQIKTRHAQHGMFAFFIFASSSALLAPASFE
jgi:hypothetical protein